MSSEQETIKLILQNINKENVVTSINKNAPHEAIVLLLHFFMHQEGFRCIGTEESAAPVELPEGKKIPQEWNKSSDAYSFKYKHWQSSMTFLLKIVKLGKQLLIHALAVEDGKPVSLELNITDFVDDQKLASLLNGQTDVKFEDCIKDIQKLESLFRINISRKLVPFLNKEGYEEAAPASSTTSASTTSSQAQQQRQPVQPMYVPPEYEDPLRIGPVRTPQRNPLQEDDFGFGVGSSDLYPQITPPMYIGGRGGFGGSGGMMMGPRHPAFTGGVPQPGRGLPPGVPPGARFDPFGPPGTGAGGSFPGSGGRGRGGQGTFGPTPDHQRRPRDFDYDDII